MTSPSPDAPAASAPPPPPQQTVVNPEPESRLDQLAARYATLKPQLTELKEQLEVVTEAIKAELTRAHPTSTDLLLTSPWLTSPLQLQQVTSWRLASTKLKAEQPALWVQYAAPSTSWTLRAVS